MDLFEGTTVQVKWIRLFILMVCCSAGVQADSERTECANEQIALHCPELESVVLNGTFVELQWTVTDPEDLKKQNVVYCTDKRLNCTRYKDIGSFGRRIQLNNPVRGKLLVKQMVLNDRLIYTCAIERMGNKGTVANKIMVSSKHCLSSTAGQNLDLSQRLHGIFLKETVEDIEWYRVSKNGTKVQIAYCGPSSPCRLVENCISSCPKYLTRLKTDGLSIILSNVTRADRGLEFQCQIHLMTKRPRVYTISIKEISPREAVDDANGTTVGTRTTSSADTTGPTGNNLGSYSILDSCLIAFSVVISLVMAPYGIS